VIRTPLLTEKRLVKQALHVKARDHKMRRLRERNSKMLKGVATDGIVSGTPYLGRRGLSEILGALWPLARVFV
jgi:hypothetical protein